MLNDSHLHAGIGLYSTRVVSGVAKRFCERVDASFGFFPPSAKPMGAAHLKS